jgi:hypothetical protein
MARRLIALVAFALWLAVAVPVARADTGDIIEPQNEPPTAFDGWQAGTCLTDEPVSGEPRIHCSAQTGPAFFKTAGGHPPIGFTQYFIQHGPFEPVLPQPPFPTGSLKAPIKEPLDARTIKTLRVDLPPGLTVNPNATPGKCTLADFRRKVEIEPGKEVIVPNCAPSTQVGVEEVTLVTNEPNFPSAGFPTGFVIPPDEGTGTKVPVYNLVPSPGEPALFGFVVGGEEEVFLETQVAWESDLHESFTIHLPPAGHLPTHKPLSTLISRLLNFGAATGNGTYISNPTTCFDPSEAAYEHLYSTWFRAESYAEPDPNFPNGSTPVEAKVEENNGGPQGVPVQQEGCDSVPFKPSIDVKPGTSQIDSPAPATVTTEMPFEVPGEGGAAQEQSHLRRAVVTLPAGMGLNPSGSNGLQACTDAQFKKGVRTYDNECPAESKIGTVEITSPPLASPLRGDIYVGEQKSSDPTSGEEFRVLVEAKEADEGVDIRLIGHTSADPVTGQLTTTFDEQEIGPLAGKLPTGLPQAPFESVVLRFDGPHVVLTSPPTCASAESRGQMEPWARPGTQAPVSSAFMLSSDPQGGTCPATLGARGFTPGYTAKTDSPKAGAYSPFRVHIGRPDGQQELKLVDVTLPKGLTGNLSGIPYCSASALDAAAHSSGRAEISSPSCPSASRIGTASTTSGTGDRAVTLGGGAYLAGPYRGAPLSMAVITPAVSGPFDLGTVLVRVALNVDPETAQIRAVSDAIPDVFGGVKLDIRSIDVNVDRGKFMLNPTSCAAQATAGTINGGGSDPASSSAWSSYAVSAPFQATQCNKLGFRPKLFTRLSGGKGVTQRAKHPKLRAILEAREGDANVARSALTLPHALFLDQGNIRTVCTRPQLASDTCPKAAIYGHAEARSPLLDGKLKGPVYLVSSDHELPDLLANLRGQVNIHLRGVITSPHGGIKTVFASTPDVPVSKFILRMEGGPHKGLLVNSRNLCRGRLSSYMNVKGQNGKKLVNKHLKLRVPCGK